MVGRMVGVVVEMMMMVGRMVEMMMVGRMVVVGKSGGDAWLWRIAFGRERGPSGRALIATASIPPEEKTKDPNTRRHGGVHMPVQTPTSCGGHGARG